MTTTTEQHGAPRTASATATLIDRLREQENRPALVGYLPVGYPTVDRSVEALKTLVDHGVDIIELGIPYTDPVLDGPVIQAAAQGALDAGARVHDVFRVVRELTDHAPHVPVLVMTYWNPVLKYGPDAFARDLAAAGGAGLITPDLIPDEGADWLAAAEAHGLDRVFLVAPSSTPERLRLTVRASRGFVYAASLMGVTGERGQVGSRAEQLVTDTRAAGADRVCVGLGVSSGAQAAEVGRFADGVIVGSALVRPLLSDEPLTDEQWAARLTDLTEVTEDLAAGVRSARATAPAGATVVPGEAP
ncbi:tryptophan synthase subunit alpha [Promicromonospora thailandica]|uniref:Tryptophan synthase alpha chain n=1 Tax=Promicromonospora thailandica TaxID=765201 RepID=A0A9X2G6R5_9MICO|nr:tryptophan synthase subunit alpha [Promicromonospora thailandica]MCP2266768.1 tryptophan synthase, alpha chain [Promicromonospora thailandica]BFF21932.1 tryptophan synthase subunit alpha [Promicromonospora thailandica]